MQTRGRDPEVDRYIAQCADFARPILSHLRLLVHKACPDVTERIKWGLPHFDFEGGTLCVLAAYTQHCAFTFIRQASMRDPRFQANPALKAQKRYLGHLKSLSDLPPDQELIRYVEEAMQLNRDGVRVAPKPAATPKKIEMPDAFAAALAADREARAVFESKSDAFRKEYIVWIADAKTDATRQKRIDEALPWIAEGKGRFWKYAKPR